MAPNWKNQAFVDGRWQKVQNKKKTTQKEKQQHKEKGWLDTKEGDWACGTCDPFQQGIIDTYGKLR